MREATKALSELRRKSYRSKVKFNIKCGSSVDDAAIICEEKRILSDSTSPEIASTSGPSYSSHGSHAKESTKWVASGGVGSVTRGLVLKPAPQSCF